MKVDTFSICSETRSRFCQQFVTVISVVAFFSFHNGILNAAPPGASETFGVHKVPLDAPARFISIPFHRSIIFSSTVGSVGSGSIAITPAPGWTPNQFAAQDGFPQFCVRLGNDLSDEPGNEGDWWAILDNTADALTVHDRGEDLTTVVQTGDGIEIRPLTSLKDVFGTGASLVLSKDSDGSVNPNDEDVIFFVLGTSFSSEVIYHDGSLAGEGYYVDGAGPFDGSTLTVEPDEPIMLFRKMGSPDFNLLVSGQAQVAQHTHYLEQGPNPIATGFAIDALVGASELLDAGWQKDSDGSVNIADDDVLFTVTGTSFSDELIYHDGSLAQEGWYANGLGDDSFLLESAKGFIVYVQNPAGLKWRQPPPF